MSRQLPQQIKKVSVLDRNTGKTVTRYQLRADGGLNSATGRRQQVKRRYATEREARDALARIGGQAVAGAFVARKTTTVEQLGQDWIASLHNARATTLNAYRFSLAPLTERHGRLPIQQLTRAQLDTLLTDLRDGRTTTAKGHTRRAWSPRSLNKAVDAWRSLLDYGMERRELAYNVATGMKKVPRYDREMQTYTADEIRCVLRVADTDRNGHLWYLALCGLRRGEIAGLTWDTCELRADRPNTLTIACNRVQAGAGNVVENEPKTKTSRRTLPLDPGLVAVLKRASTRQAKERLKLGAAYADSGYVAVNQAGEPYTPDTLTRMWHKVTKAAGVRPIRLHEARHSCGTVLHLRGVPLAVIAKWLGHHDASVTARIYAHSQPEELNAASATLGQVVSSE